MLSLVYLQQSVVLSILDPQQVMENLFNPRTLPPFPGAGCGRLLRFKLPRKSVFVFPRAPWTPYKSRLLSTLCIPQQITGVRDLIDFPTE